MTTKTEAIALIEAALAAGPTTWNYDSNQTPFYNDADGHSRGGNSDGTYCLYGPDFFIDEERYEGPILVDRCDKKDAVYIAETNPAAMREVLAHIAAQDAEIARLREANGDPLQGAVDWLLEADRDFLCVATVQRTLRIGYNRAQRLCDKAKESAALAQTGAEK